MAEKAKEKKCIVFNFCFLMPTFFQEKAALSAQVEEMMEQSLVLFQKRDDLDELEGFQQQELAKVKHMVRTVMQFDSLFCLMTLGK